MLRKIGFTLAEVLITLGIIGVVAAMTIPALINNTGQAEFKTAFKKNISTLNQSVTMNVAVDSVDLSQLTSGTCTTVGSICYMFNNRMNVMNLDSAVADTTLDPPGTFPAVASTSNYTLFFNDGSVFSFPTACNAPSFANSTSCKGIIDTNGGKGPNRLSNCRGVLNVVSENSIVCTNPAGNVRIADRYSVRFGDGLIIPNGNAARYALYN